MKTEKGVGEEKTVRMKRGPKVGANDLESDMCPCCTGGMQRASGVHAHTIARLHKSI